MGAPKINTTASSPIGNELQVVFKESLRILRSRSWAGLGASLSFCIQNLLSQAAVVEVWVNEEFHSNESRGHFHRTDRLETLHPDQDALTPDELRSKRGLHIHVHREAKKSPILWIRITGLDKEQPVPENFKGLWTSLTPSIVSACELILHIISEREKTRLENELKTAEIVQRTLIPPGDIELPGLKIAASYRSALECGGDWWGVYRLSESESLILLGDVTGHGTASALVSALVKGYADASTRRPGFELERLLVELNEDLYSLGQGEVCLSFIGLLFDSKKAELQIMNAGHPTPLLIQGGEISALLTEVGPVLGFEPELPKGLVPQRVQLAPGSHLLIYTDGLTEAQNREGRAMGEGRLLKALKSLPSEGPITGALIRAKLLQLQADWLYGRRPEDDTSLIVLSF